MLAPLWAATAQGAMAPGLVVGSPGGDPIFQGIQHEVLLYLSPCLQGGLLLCGRVAAMQQVGPGAGPEAGQWAAQQ